MNSNFQMVFCIEPPMTIHKIKMRLKIDFQTFGVFRTPMTHPNAYPLCHVSDLFKGYILKRVIIKDYLIVIKNNMSK